MPIPYISVDAGLIYDPGKKLDCLLSDFFEAEYSQSYLFHGSISSLPWILQQYQDDTALTASTIRNQLLVYLGLYFDSVEVETGVEETASLTGYNIRVFVQVTQGDQTVTLYNRLKISGTKLEESIKIRE